MDPQYLPDILLYVPRQLPFSTTVRAFTVSSFTSLADASLLYFLFEAVRCDSLWLPKLVPTTSTVFIIIFTFISLFPVLVGDVFLLFQDKPSLYVLDPSLSASSGLFSVTSLFSIFYPDFLNLNIFMSLSYLAKQIFPLHEVFSIFWLSLFGFHSSISWEVMFFSYFHSVCFDLMTTVSMKLLFPRSPPLS